MNLPRVTLAAVVAWGAYVPIGWLAHGVLLTDLHAAQASARGEVATNVSLGFGVALAGFFAFGYTYAKGYERGQGVHEGIRFGVLVVLMLIAFAGVWSYVVFQFSGRLAAALAIDYVVEFAIYGMIVGAIYRPVQAAGAYQPAG